VKRDPEFDVTWDGPRALLAVRGEVDLDSSPDFLAAIQRALQHHHDLVVDLEAVRYIDSSGIAVLVQGQKQARSLGRSFRLRRPSPRVQAVIRLAQLDRLFEIEAGDS
jgi:anti-sigma B factor antagonist